MTRSRRPRFPARVAFLVLPLVVGCDDADTPQSPGLPDSTFSVQARIAHRLWNFQGPIDICGYQQDNVEIRLLGRLNEAAFPDGIPYGAITPYFELEMVDHQQPADLGVLVFAAPAPPCPPTAPSSEEAAQLPGFLYKTGTGFLFEPAIPFERLLMSADGYSNSPLATALAVCGASQDQPCGPPQLGESWSWAAEDDPLSIPRHPDSTQISLAIPATSLNSMFNLCWDPDDAGPSDVVPIDPLGLSAKNFSPMLSGVVWAQDSACAIPSGRLVSRSLPVEDPEVGTVAVLAAGSAVKVVITGAGGANAPEWARLRMVLLDLDP